MSRSGEKQQKQVLTGKELLLLHRVLHLKALLPELLMLVLMNRSTHRLCFYDKENVKDCQKQGKL